MMAGGDLAPPQGDPEDVINKRVLVVGLVKQPAFNGEWGRVESYDPELERFVVRVLRDTGPPLLAKLRRENLLMPPTLALRFDDESKGSSGTQAEAGMDRRPSTNSSNIEVADPPVFPPTPSQWHEAAMDMSNFRRCSGLSTTSSNTQSEVADPLVFPPTPQYGLHWNEPAFVGLPCAEPRQMSADELFVARAAALQASSPVPVMLASPPFTGGAHTSTMPRATGAATAEALPASTIPVSADAGPDACGYPTIATGVPAGSEGAEKWRPTLRHRWGEADLDSSGTMSSGPKER